MDPLIPDYGNQFVTRTPLTPTFGLGAPAAPAPALGGIPTPGAPSGSPGGLFGIQGLGKNLSTINAGLTGFQTLAGLWSAMQAMKMAKKQYAFTRATTNANLANQTQSYNTELADRARSRGAVEGQSASQIDDYIAKNRLAPRTV